LAIEVDRQRSTAEAATGEQARKATNDAREVWVRRTKHTMTCVRGIVGGIRAVIDPFVYRHNFKFTSVRPVRETNRN
jgi:hypothetical protein